jgi:hypothetical protein
MCRALVRIARASQASLRGVDLIVRSVALRCRRLTRFCQSRILVRKEAAGRYANLCIATQYRWRSNFPRAAIGQWLIDVG